MKSKELYLYSGIYDFIAERLISQLNDAGEQDVTLRINTPGGSVFAGWGIIAKMQERSKEGYSTKIKLDGAAMSMGAMILAFAEDVEALDVSTVMLHRASMYVSNDTDKAFLDQVNKDLRKKLESKINGEKLKEIKGVSIKDLFDKEERIDLFLTAKEAKEIGLINRVNKVQPKELEALNTAMADAEKYFNVAASVETQSNQNQKSITMNIEKLKAEHPEVYNQVFNAGINAERDRVGAFMALIEADPKAIAEAIKKGETLTQTQTVELTMKLMTNKLKSGIEADGKETPDANANANDGEEEKEKTAVADFEKSLRAELGLK
jgi:ATP-dependent Clp protease, protease subunit